MHEVAFKGCIHEGSFFCCVNEHSADPHYCPTEKKFVEIRKGDFILIDLWCKLKKSGSVYADITRVGIAADEPTQRQQEVFEIVKRAQHTGLDLVKSRFAAGLPLMGWEIDVAVRQVVEAAGYGKVFTHRTGHNMYDQDHGRGAHLDNLETRDLREILPGTCFTIEPGIYLPGEFGVRLEFDVFIDHERGVHVTGGIQEGITCLFAKDGLNGSF
jgi:Xaa-Pro aminopeptidase